MGHGRDEAVRVERYGIDSLLDEKGREFGIIARRLAADADLDAGRVRFLDGFTYSSLHSLVAFIEQRRQLGRIAVDPEDELGQIVTADRKAIEPLCKFLGKNDVRRNFAHHVDLQALLATFQ